VSARLQVPTRELRFRFVRSSGAGGQNVNKVASKAVLRWDVVHSPSLPPDVRARFLARYARRLTTEGELVLASDRFRDQARNVADCVERLNELLQAVAAPPVPRRPTRPSGAARARRLAVKRQRGEAKARRRPPHPDLD